MRGITVEIDLALANLPSVNLTLEVRVIDV